MGIPEGPELAEVFAQMARDLQTETTPEQRRGLGLWWRRCARCQDAITPGYRLVHRHGRIDTQAASDDVGPAVAAIQYKVGQDPCLEAIREHESFRRASQRLNVKLRDVASVEVDKGEFPEHRNSPSGAGRYRRCSLTCRPFAENGVIPPRRLGR